MSRAVRLFAPPLALGLFVALCGLRWGLPGERRFEALPPALAHDPRAAERLASDWEKLYNGIEQAHRSLAHEEPVTYVRGVETFAPGWTYPPAHLIGSVRSTLLRTEHPDEQQTLAELARMRPGRLDFKPLYIHYGGSYLYAFGAVLWLSAKAGALKLVPGAAYYLLHPDDMGRLFLAGRLFIAAFFLLSLGLVVDLARLCAGDEAGLAAGVFYALCPVVVAQSHIFKPHVFAAFWILAAARLAVAAARSGRTRDFLLCGLCAGLGAGASFFMLAFGALPAAAAWLRRRERGAWAGAVAGGALCAAVFAAANPYYFLAHADYVWETTIYPGARGVASLAGVAGFFGRPLAQSMGGLLEFLCALGLWRACRAGAGDAWRLCAGVLAAGVVVLGLAVGLLWGFSGGPGTARFFFPLFGLACAVAGAWAAGPGPHRGLRLALAAAAVLELSARSGVYLRNFAADSTSTSTRERAALWIESGVPSGAAVGLARFPQPFSTPPFRYDRHPLVIFEDPALIAPKKLPEFIVVDASDRDVLERRLPGRYALAQAFLPEWTSWLPIADDGFFANAPMFVYRRIAQ